VLSTTFSMPHVVGNQPEVLDEFDLRLVRLDAQHPANAAK